MRMSEEGGGGYRSSGGGPMSWFGLVMVAVVIAIAVAIVFLVFLRLYSKWYLRRHRPSHTNRDINNPISGNVVAGGLDASILRSLPVVTLKVGDLQDGMECSVCLCEVSEGEKARLLPNCNHGFHLECIDMWFGSHSTCPLCRSTVSPAPVPVSGGAPPETMMDIPTNVLFWGSDDQVNAGRARVQDGSTSPSTSSTSSSTTSSSSPAAGAGEGDGGGKILIDVARQDGVAAESSPRSPAARLKSFRRLFNREGRSMASSTREGGEGDVELGMAKL